MKPMMIAACLMAASLPVQAVFKCVENGKTIYSDAPCGQSARVIDTTPPRGNDAPNIRTRAGALSDQVDDMARERHTRDIAHEIRNTERRIARLQDRMNAEVAALRKKKAAASNNLAGATWEQSISTEMQAITMRYQAEMQTERLLLDDLRRQYASMVGH